MEMRCLFFLCLVLLATQAGAQLPHAHGEVALRPSLGHPYPPTFRNALRSFQAIPGTRRMHSIRLDNGNSEPGKEVDTSFEWCSYNTAGRPDTFLFWSHTWYPGTPVYLVVNKYNEGGDLMEQLQVGPVTLSAMTPQPVLDSAAVVGSGAAGFCRQEQYFISYENGRPALVKSYSVGDDSDSTTTHFTYAGGKLLTTFEVRHFRYFIDSTRETATYDRQGRILSLAKTTWHYDRPGPAYYDQSSFSVQTDSTALAYTGRKIAVRNYDHAPDSSLQLSDQYWLETDREGRIIRLRNARRRTVMRNRYHPSGRSVTWQRRSNGDHGAGRFTNRFHFDKTGRLISREWCSGIRWSRQNYWYE